MSSGEDDYKIFEYKCRIENENGFFETEGEYDARNIYSAIDYIQKKYGHNLKMLNIKEIKNGE